MLQARLRHEPTFPRCGSEVAMPAESQHQRLPGAIPHAPLDPRVAQHAILRRKASGRAGLLHDALRAVITWTTMLPEGLR